MQQFARERSSVGDLFNLPSLQRSSDFYGGGAGITISRAQLAEGQEQLGRVEQAR